MFISWIFVLLSNLSVHYLSFTSKRSFCCIIEGSSLSKCACKTFCSRVHLQFDYKFVKRLTCIMCWHIWVYVVSLKPGTTKNIFFLYLLLNAKYCFTTCS
ncbi:hypothetical protein QVD17_22865 [Tagetes erecta]|uniref:Secreted protein n=1 Tax=Tagetes erecta TaxID=13708 RepID=A0AAD8NTX4_TARER|nr:hypothetical protein QVD17_22865 [Tagetes erecta]